MSFFTNSSTLDSKTNIEAVIADMDLLLEGVTPPEKNINLDKGLSILENNLSNFSYSSLNLSYLEKIRELKAFYRALNINNQEMLEIISNSREKVR